MNFKTSKITSRDLGPNGRSYTVKLTTAEGDSALVGGLDWDVAPLIAAAPDMLDILESILKLHKNGILKLPCSTFDAIVLALLKARGI